MKCHPERSEGSPEELSLEAQLFGDSSPSAQNDIKLLMQGTSLYRYRPTRKFYQYNDGDFLSILTL